MKITGILFLFCLVLLSCGSDENAGSSKFIIVNQVNGGGNISLYDYPDNKLTEQYFTINSQIRPSQIYNVVKSGNYIYMLTGSPALPPMQLRKIDFAAGAQIKEVDSWITSLSSIYMDYYPERVVLSYVDYNTDKGKYFSYIKIFNDNLVLLDSIAQEDVREIRAAKVVNNRLFYHVVIEDVGLFIQVMDLTTKVIIDSIEVPLSNQFIYLNEDQLLVVTSNGHFILNTESLISSETKPTLFGSTFITHSAKENVLYLLRPNAQPSLTQYTLGKVDLATGQYTSLSKTGEHIDGPILYDETTNVIVTGGAGLKIFSTSGSLLKTVEMPYTTRHILK